MIRELTWDSLFFREKIGELSLSAAGVKKLPGLIQQAKKNGVRYLVCRSASLENALVQALETQGFTLLDIGVTWGARSGQLLTHTLIKRARIKGLKVAEERDIPMLRKMTSSLFSKSRFYRDPFFSKKQANDLYQAWIENSVKGTSADIVFYIPGAGLVTCRKTGNVTGSIDLIGVKAGMRGKGFGTSLLNISVKWFHTHGIHEIRARTQLNNINAMNFYARSGFSIKGYDLIFSKIL